MSLFDSGANYAAHRPSYPDELPGILAGLPTHARHALDVGCGTGQLTASLGAHFTSVLGIDPSKSQIDAASGPDNVRYEVAAAEELPVEDSSVDLVTVAQAAHWIEDLDAFYAEARRVARPGAAIALISYGVCHLDGLDDIYQEFYWGDFHRHWAPARRHVDNRLAELDFPFSPIAVSCPDIVRNLNFEHFVAYLKTWSAMKSPGAAEEFAAFEKYLKQEWGEPETIRRVSWPVTVRAGTL